MIAFGNLTCECDVEIHHFGITRGQLNPRRRVAIVVGDVILPQSILGVGFRVQFIVGIAIEILGVDDEPIGDSVSFSHRIGDFDVERDLRRTVETDVRIDVTERCGITIVDNLRLNAEGALNCECNTGLLGRISETDNLEFDESTVGIIARCRRFDLQTDGLRRVSV